MADFSVSSSSFSLMSDQNLMHTGAECWLTAEKTSQKILSMVQPTVVSDGKRFEIINYIRKLIRDVVGDKVIAFGSTPLKTYLPDGDIDLTVLATQTDVECLARSTYSILEEQRYGGSSIRDVQFVDAQVKVVKCMVQHIPVDISFNQVAGLKTLCFLEQIDQYIGRGHLFKRSIVLIKAWCFYESRVLGSHCGLMSTYALEILVFYIINRFHRYLNGPLAVLYKFLDYYSTFDWDKYCMSLYGPVFINSLPKVFVEKAATRGTKFLLRKNLLQSCINSFSVPNFETERQAFPRKHLNIIDPLKGKNNLGRSISEGNFYRIKFAFAYGCQKLNDVLRLPVEGISDGVMTFFVNTYERTRMRQMLDREVSSMACNSRTRNYSGLKGDYDCPIECLNYAQWHINSDLDIFQQSSLPIFSSLFQSQSIEDQFIQSVHYPGEKYLGKSAYVPSASSNGKFKLSASASPFVSSAVGEKVQCEGTELSISKVDMERKPESKETELCSPSAQCYDWQMNLSQVDRTSGGLSPKTSKDQPVDVPIESNRIKGSICSDLSVEELHLLPSRKKAIESDKNGKSCCFDMSLDNFPLLPSSKKPIQSEKHNQGQLTIESDKTGESSCFDLSLDNFPLLPSSKKPIQSEKHNQGQLTIESDKNGESSCFDLSLDNFPLLPSSKKPIQPEKHNQGQLTKDSPQDGKLSNCKEGSSIAVSFVSLLVAKKTVGSCF